jgi:TPR repeat protein
MNNMALMLESGFISFQENNEDSIEKAFELYKRSHSLGNTNATINLALIYLNG